MSGSTHSSGTANRKSSKALLRNRRGSSRLGVECLESRALLTTMIGLTNANSLLTFDSSTPGTIRNTIPITGLPTGETILSITDRPSTGSLLGVGLSSHLYSIQLNTGAATAISSSPFSPTLVGSRASISTNPVTDTVRLVDDSGQNLRLSPSSGSVVQTDPMLAYASGDPNAAAAPDLVAIASTNSASGATSTTVYGIDPALDVLVRLGSPGGSPTSPNTGQLSTVGLLGVKVNDTVGFDIVGPTNDLEPWNLQ